MTNKDKTILSKDEEDKKLSASHKYRREDEYEAQQINMSHALQQLLHEKPKSGDKGE